MNKDRLLYLLAQKNCGAITQEEEGELTRLAKENEQNAFLAAGIDEVMQSTLSYKVPDSSSMNEALDLLHLKIQQPTLLRAVKNRKPVKIWIAAASILLLLCCGLFYMLKPVSSALNADNVVVTRKGSKTMLILPDGSKVWVNADTRLTYSKAYGKTTRDVMLTGEAFFDVAHDAAHPFIVHTASMDVKVLGTAFNVRSYPDESNAQTTLIRGRVEVSLKNKAEKKVILSPNEKLVVPVAKNTQTGIVPTDAEPIALLKIRTSPTDSLSNETAWTKNRLVFDQQKLEDILPVLERWYNVTIEVKTPPSTLVYNGTFDNDSLGDVLDALKTIGGFHYAIDKNKVTIF